MSNLLKKDKGFTLIEIVLVLAIAGLLLVIVFLAVQGAQRSRRDTQRKHDASLALAAMESCAANNNGAYPAACTTGLTTAVAGSTAYFSGTSPKGTAYTAVAVAPTVDGQIQPAAGPCPGGAASTTAHVLVWQESGTVYCAHN